MIDILKRLEKTYDGSDLELLKQAYAYARKAHENQKRASGEEYFIHPCTVAGILVDLGLDAATIAAAFLHDVIEDTPVSEGDIKKEFGEEVLELVLGVTKLEKIEFGAFECCTGIEKLKLSNNLKKIDDFAFWGCTSLKTVEVPKSVRVIGKKAFGGCTSLEEIRIPRWCWLKRGWKKDTKAKVVRY